MYFSPNCCLPFFYTLLLNIYVAVIFSHLYSSAVVFLNYIAGETECPVQFMLQVTFLLYIPDILWKTCTRRYFYR